MFFLLYHSTWWLFSVHTGCSTRETNKHMVPWFKKKKPRQGKCDNLLHNKDVILHQLAFLKIICNCRRDWNAIAQFRWRKHSVVVQNRKVGQVLAMEFRDVGSVLMQYWHLILLCHSFLPIKWGLYYFASSVVLSHLHYRHFRTATISWLSLVMSGAIRT